jgi:hypothetical protein
MPKIPKKKHKKMKLWTKKNKNAAISGNMESKVYEIQRKW